MLQALINLFKPSKKESVEVKVEDTVKVEAPAPVPVAEIKPAPAPTPVKKTNKGRPKGSKPSNNQTTKLPRKKK